MPNIEIKARYGNLKKARAIARQLKARRIGFDFQVDTYFRTKAGRLKLRESSVTRDAALIPYSRPDQAGPKKSLYLVIPVKEASLCKALLSRILGVETVVGKKREVFLVDNVRVHLDEVEGLGTFLELEAVYAGSGKRERAQREKVRKLMSAFGIGPADLVEGSYRDLKLKRPVRGEAFS